MCYVRIVAYNVKAFRHVHHFKQASWPLALLSYVNMPYNLVKRSFDLYFIFCSNHVCVLKGALSDGQCAIWSGNGPNMTVRALMEIV